MQRRLQKEMPELELFCACGSREFYENCCKAYHKGVKMAPTALVLMRSRYSAFVYGEIDYLVETTFPTRRTDDLKDDFHLAYGSVRWIGLEIMSTSQGKSSDKVGKVEFKASYFEDGHIKIHYEHSRFRRKKGKWYYVDGV